ncbi:MAG: response regulator transcription factor [Hyphomicrobiales bacterium]
MNNENHKILLVDDEADVLEFVGYNLKKEGYNVVTASNGREAIDRAKSEQPSLIIMDVMMPEMDGIEACSEIRSLPGMDDLIILFLTARGEDYSQIAGFDAGGDDYVTKPIRPKVLVSRIKALLRRKNMGRVEEAFNEGVIQLSDLTIDKERYIVIKEGKEIILPRKEFELLQLLTSKPNKVFTRDEIFSSVWGTDVVVGDRTIDVHVRKIREKIGLNSIKTVKGVGYKYEPVI